VNDGVTVWSHTPVPAAAWKSFAAGGAVPPAGSTIGYVSPFEAGVQLAAPSQTTEGAACTATDVVGNVWGDPPPVEKVVDVPDTLQPAVAVPSPMSSARLFVTVWAMPVSALANETSLGFVANPSERVTPTVELT
jgi:hypothetical protein